ncbi:hypothetical protein NA56DRAFT_705226 [Hyaloscypha hepaticicola]|uniref:Uncharacterized protein n=1 Tax=Hyaloscypha hepaticicola TaxID=2082293 RepID=A0A2J6Q128_9HELO|nr:hypothetical protein NA56DRAFT_705226 [Hyaloscypha hepaticicola]
MSSATEKPAILPPPKITLPIRKRNEVILPPGVAHASRPSIPPLPPLPPFYRLSSGNDTIEDLEERDLDGLPILLPALRPAGYYNPGTRMQALTMIESFLYQIRDKAIKRGYNPKVSKLLLDKYVADKPRKSRSTISLDIIAIIEDIVTKNSTTRSYSCAAIAAEVATRLGVKKACVEHADWTMEQEIWTDDDRAAWELA